MTRRVVLGKQADGSYALRTSLPGHDALLADDDDTEALSFNSNWENLLKVHQVGVVSAGTVAEGSPNVSVPFTSLGYIPFAEARIISGDVVYDDRIVSITRFPTPPATTTITSLHACISTNNFRLYHKIGGTGVLYAIYKHQ